MQARTISGLLLNKKVILGLFLVFSVLTPIGVYAQESTLEQQLLEPDCSTTGACEMEPPTITDLNMNGNKPIIKGTYDAAFSKNLRVIFGERVYILGVDEQLTAVGGAWELNLSGLSQPLAVGAYELIVETEGYDGDTKQVNMVTVITQKNDINTNTSVSDNPTTAPGLPSDTPTDQPVESPPVEDDPEDIPRPMSPEEAKAKVSLTPLLVTLALSATLIALGAGLSWQKHKN